MGIFEVLIKSKKKKFKKKSTKHVLANFFSNSRNKKYETKDNENTYSDIYYDKYGNKTYIEGWHG